MIQTKRNRWLKIARALFIAQCALLFMGCGDDSKTSPEQVNREILTSGTWVLTSLTVDDVDQTPLFAGMILEFTDAGFIATAGDPVWSMAGTWSFSNDDATTLMLDNGVEVTITTINDSQLTLELEWEETTYGGRVGSVSGHHIFQFSKQ